MAKRSEFPLRNLPAPVDAWRVAQLAFEKIVDHFDRLAARVPRLELPGTATAPYITPTDAPPTTATYATIDLSQDAAPDHAIGAMVQWRAGGASGTSLTYRVSASGTAHTIGQFAAGGFDSPTFPAFFDADTKSFQVGSDQNLTTSALLVLGWIY